MSPLQMLVVASQLVYGNIGKLFAVRLGHIEDAHHLEGGAGHFIRLSDRLAVLVENGLLRPRPALPAQVQRRYTRSCLFCRQGIPY